MPSFYSQRLEPLSFDELLRITAGAVVGTSPGPPETAALYVGWKGLTVILRPLQLHERKRHLAAVRRELSGTVPVAVLDRVTGSRRVYDLRVVGHADPARLDPFYLRLAATLDALYLTPEGLRGPDGELLTRDGDEPPLRCTVYTPRAMPLQLDELRRILGDAEVVADPEDQGNLLIRDASLGVRLRSHADLDEHLVVCQAYARLAAESEDGERLAEQMSSTEHAYELEAPAAGEPEGLRRLALELARTLGGFVYHLGAFLDAGGRRLIRPPAAGRA